MTDHRREPRKVCKIRATIRAGRNECRAYVVDLNEFGLRLLSENADRTISEGDEIEIHTKDIGLIKGRVRWRSSHRIGIELSDGAGVLAGCASSLPAELGTEDITLDGQKIVDDLARVASRPEMFTKAEMASVMKRAAQKIQRDERRLASMKEILSEVIFVRQGEDHLTSAARSAPGH